MAQKLVFGYWAQRARGMPIRFLLEYTEADYIEKTYFFDKQGEWFDQDKKVFNPFPNLPYIKDGDFYLTETESIIKYVARRNPKYHELLGIGKGNDEYRLDQVNNVITEMRQYVREQFNDPNVHEVKRDFLNRCQKKFSYIVNLRGNNKFIFPYVTTADFKFVELLLYYKCLDEELFNKNLPSLNEYITNFYSLPRIAEYVKTDRYRSHYEFFPQHRALITGKDFVTQFNKQFQ